MECIQQRGARWDDVKKDHNGSTALMIAVDNCHFSIIEEILSDREREVHEKDNAGSPVVAYGLHSQWSEILPMLEERGA
eukprot:CAMPEP_0201532976 /NCGR_PEP_ID=MMETSP0161_2-20130828/51796_1 /ASSEMBLY_ACC=CAM_ASM_000251 /TAXON_ID=180227 /ORGANISM="Neoparamoeba aestuarina, Strain SoJaBio B1-5/56/2" /LENGTH=78 /DNA_ID=CAMNT_0047936687 /DNA_START=205 /DNA_END=437 /DNA_ORIENTATION=+